MGIINVLDPQVANLIAAGEVVDRPASVVKELLENAIDAGSTAVTVEIKHGGITFLRVSDNGCGMSRDDVPVCIRRHATSKIHGEEDLDGIMTLGFRGEALAAIGAVSTLRILTKQPDKPMGTQLTCVGGEIREIIESGGRDGTTVIVEELFANVPARRKFLKKDSSEALAVAAVVEKIALSRPDLSIKFISDGVMRFGTAGDGDLINCIHAVLGRDFAKKLSPVHGMTNGIEVKGYVGTPENIRANRNYQNFFINGRYIKSRTAMAAIEQAFSSYIPSEKFPVCVLEIKIHPALVDVNVHPAKLEVKFSNEQAVFDAVYSAVRTSLEKNLSRPEFGLKTKEEARKEARIISAFVPLKDGPSDTVGKGTQLSLPVTESNEPAVSGIHLYSSHASELPPHLRFQSKSAVAEKQSEAPLPFAFDATVDNDIPLSSTVSVQTGKSATAEKAAVSEETTPIFSKSEPIFTKAEPIFTKPEQAVSEVIKKEEAPELKKTEYSVSSIPRASATDALSTAEQSVEYRILGEAFNSYIILEMDGQLIMIDKHAAHERVLFEDMKKNISSGASSQILLIPLEIRLSHDELDAVIRFEHEIRATGFEFTADSSERLVKVTAIPSVLSASDAETLFVTIAGQLASGTGNASVARNIFYEQALHQASCKAAIKAGRVYDQAHIEWLCRRVVSDPAIRFCPHGRPVAFELSKNDIEHWFKRK